MKKTALFILSVVLIILSVPLIAMKFTNEVNWDVYDFWVAAILLFGLGLMISFLWQRFSKSKYKVPIIIVTLILFILLWIELAVGIFGSPIAGS